MKGHVRVIVLLAVLSSFFAWGSSLAAEKSRFGVGVQPLGFSVNPDQYVFGVQGILGRVKILQFVPSLDLGYGQSQKLMTVNLDLLFDVFSPPQTKAVFYVGTGPAINMIKPDGGERDTEIGLNLLGGVKLPFGSKHYYNLEARYGIGDVPDFKLLLGVMFGFGSTG